MCRRGGERRSAAVGARCWGGGEERRLRARWLGGGASLGLRGAARASARGRTVKCWPKKKLNLTLTLFSLARGCPPFLSRHVRPLPAGHGHGLHPVQGRLLGHRGRRDGPGADVNPVHGCVWGGGGRERGVCFFPIAGAGGHAHGAPPRRPLCTHTARVPACTCAPSAMPCLRHNNKKTHPPLTHAPVPAVFLSPLSRISLPILAVDGGERAVMYDRVSGIRPDPVGEGTHFRIPWVQVRGEEGGERRGGGDREEGMETSPPSRGRRRGQHAPPPPPPPPHLPPRNADPARHGHPHPATHHLLGDGDEW